MTHVGSAGAPKSWQSAATRRVRQQANLQIFDRNLRSPPARGFRRPTRILDTSGSRSSKHYANDALRELRIPILETSAPKSSIRYANYALRELRIQVLDTSGPISLMHYANCALRELRIRILATSGPRSSLHYQN